MSLKKSSFVEYVIFVLFCGCSYYFVCKLNDIDMYKVPLMSGMCGNVDDTWHYEVSPGPAPWPNMAVEIWNCPEVSEAIKAQC